MGRGVELFLCGDEPHSLHLCNRPNPRIGKAPLQAGCAGERNQSILGIRGAELIDPAGQSALLMEKLFPQESSRGKLIKSDPESRNLAFTLFPAV